MKFILDIGYNHNGSVEKAKKMIDELAELKEKKYPVHGVKFQKWDVENMPQDIAELKRDKEDSFGATYRTHRRRLELSIEQHVELKAYAEERNLIYSCSGKDFASFKAVVEDIGCTHVKVPSQFLLRHDIFEYLGGNKKLAVYVSFGMHTDDEIRATKYWRWAAVKYYCVSLYPPSPRELNIKIMTRFGFNGYSSHELGGAAIPLAIAYGAQYIERHYTFDKNAKGADHKISSDKDELEKILQISMGVETMTGSQMRNLTPKEMELRAFYGRF